MIKSKYITVIGAVLIVVAMVFTMLFATGTISVFKPASANPKYADSLFDTSYVHKINIRVNEADWQEMLENAINEEYISCDITIDGETLKNVAIRPKGNTSLSSVSSMDSDRYSFKVEFDHYDDGITYKGLDKLALNNLIQDNTYMKDYLSYRIMQEAGAAAPLCSFTYVTVNGNDWGLYLAIEAVEESFAKRVYGNNYGQLYKPDSMNMGNRDEDNGRGGFEMPGGMPEFTDEMRAEFEERMKNRDFEMPEGMPQNMGEGTFGGPQNPMNTQQKFREPEALPDQNIPGFSEQNNPFAQRTQQESQNKATDTKEQPNRGGFGGFGGGGVSALTYQDDALDSYSVIFDSAVFNPDDADKERVVQALKNLSEGNLESSVDTDGLTRYFAAHNFLVNFDSYTGSILHNYYLYEEDGKLCMIPWDYNLAFGTFGGMGGRNNYSVDSATQYVNYPIDTPLASASLEDRPMIGQLLLNEETKEMYHSVLSQLVDGYFKSGDFEREFNRTFEMLAEYVQKDPTKFCTFDEFVKGSETIKEFCLLRAKSIEGQLDGTIPATTEGQSADSSALIDASHITISDMGGIGGMGGGPKMEFGGTPQEGEAEPVFNEDPNLNKNRFGKFGGKGPMGDFGQQQQPEDKKTDIIVLSICGVLLLAGLIFVFAYKKKR